MLGHPKQRLDLSQSRRLFLIKLRLPICAVSPFVPLARHTHLAQQALQFFIMLPGQNLGWSHQRALEAVANHLHQRRRRHCRFARTHIALEQPGHRERAAQIVEDLPNHPLLCPRQREFLVD